MHHIVVQIRIVGLADSLHPGRRIDGSQRAFQILGALFHNMEIHDITRDVARTKRQSGHILQAAVLIYRHGCCLCSEIRQHTSESFFLIGQDSISKSNLAHLISGNVDLQFLTEEAVDVALGLGTAHYQIGRHADAPTHGAFGTRNRGFVHSEFTRNNLIQFAVGIRRQRSIVHQTFDHLVRDLHLFRECLLHLTRKRHERTSAHSYINRADFAWRHAVFYLADNTSHQ